HPDIRNRICTSLPARRADTDLALEVAVRLNLDNAIRRGIEGREAVGTIRPGRGGLIDEAAIAIVTHEIQDDSGDPLLATVPLAVIVVVQLDEARMAAQTARCSRRRRGARRLRREGVVACLRRRIVDQGDGRAAKTGRTKGRAADPHPEPVIEVPGTEGR